MVTPYYADDLVTIYHGDCREIIPTLPTVDAIVTDPPYSSGGMYRSDRAVVSWASWYLLLPVLADTRSLCID